MWEIVEVWKDGHDVVFRGFTSMVDATKFAATNQMPWSEEVVDHIIIRRVKE